MMELFGGELGLLGGGEGLRDDVMYPSSGLALAAAYHDIKSRLASLERENSSIRGKLQHYEVKFPMISDFMEQRTLCCFCDSISKETSVIQSESTNLQQRVNSLTQELQKSKEREERLEDVIQAYEKIHLEKSNVQRDLDKMTSLADQHIDRIRSLEAAVLQGEAKVQQLSVKLHSRESVHSSLNVPRDGRGATLQSSRSLDALSDLKLQRLEAELEGARHQVEGACQREQEMQAELQHLQQEVAQLQETQRQDLAPPCEHCNVEWIKKAGDEQVSLALVYTELTEELSRVRGLVSEQSVVLRGLEPARFQTESILASRLPPALHHLSPTSTQRPPCSPVRLLPSPPLSPSPSSGPSSYSHWPTSSRLRATFQSRRSYSEVSDPSALHRPPARLMRDPVSTLPKPRSLLGEKGVFFQPRAQLRTSLVGLVRPASAHGAGGGGGGGGGGGSKRGGGGSKRGGGGSSLSNSPHHRPLDLPFPLVSEMQHFCLLDDPPEPSPLVTQPQSSDEEEEWACPSPAASPPRTLGVSVIGSTSPRQPAPHPSFSAPEGPASLSCHLTHYSRTEHAQSWPSINLWMEAEQSAVRSCPLCQLTFPTGYPDDALIRHIDSHLENSKI